MIAEKGQFEATGSRDDVKQGGLADPAASRARSP